MNKTILFLSILIPMPGTVHGMKNDKFKLVKLSDKSTEKGKKSSYIIHSLGKDPYCHRGGKWGCTRSKCHCEDDIKQAAEKYKNFCEEVTYVDSNNKENKITFMQNKNPNAVIIYLDPEGEIVKTFPYRGALDKEAVEKQLNSKPEVGKIIEKKYGLWLISNTKYCILGKKGRFLESTYDLKGLKKHFDLGQYDREEQNYSSCTIQ